MSINPGDKTSSQLYNTPKKLTLISKLNNNKASQKKLSGNELYETNEESPDELLSKILDTINTNSLNAFYPDSNNEFKKKIDSLNLEFYLETEKFLINKNHSEKCQTSLFIILFKQINIYIEEIERLNLIIMNKRYDPKKIIERTDEIIKKQNEFLTKENLIKALKDSKSNMENKLLAAIISENKLKKEIEILKKEKEQYKNQISNNINNNNLDNIKTEKDNNNMNSNAINKTKKINILHKLTHSFINSRTIDNDNIQENYAEQFENKNNISENELFLINIRKRNHSDHNKFILNNSLNKSNKKGDFKFKEKIKEKLKLKNHKNIEKKSSNQITSSLISKKNQISIKLIHENSGFNFPNFFKYKGIRTNISKIQILENKNKNIIDDNNNTNNEIKPTKTEYNINDLSDINNKKNKKRIVLKSKEKKDKNKDKINKDNKDNKDKDKKNEIFSNIKDKDIKDNSLLISFKQNPSIAGKNSNKKK